MSGCRWPWWPCGAVGGVHDASCSCRRDIAHGDCSGGGGASGGARRAPCRCRRRRHRTDRRRRTRDRSRRCRAASRAARARRRFSGRCGGSRSASSSQVPCHSSPSTHVTPVTKRFDSIVRSTLPVAGSIWWILRSRYWPTHRLPSAQARPESLPLAGRGNRGHHAAGGGIDLVDARLGDLVEVLAVERGAGVAGAVEACASSSPLAGSKAISRVPVATQTLLAVVAHAVRPCSRRGRGRTRARSRHRAGARLPGVV